MTHGFDTNFLVAAEVAEHPEHAGVWRRIGELRNAGGGFGLTTLVLAEFVHVVNDARRFTHPLPHKLPRAFVDHAPTARLRWRRALA